MALMNMGASVIARLRNKSKGTGKPLQLYLQLFCQEEFLCLLKLQGIDFTLYGKEKVSRAIDL